MLPKSLELPTWMSLLFMEGPSAHTCVCANKWFRTGSGCVRKTNSVMWGPLNHVISSWLAEGPRDWGQSHGQRFNGPCLGTEIPGKPLRPSSALPWWTILQTYCYLLMTPWCQDNDESLLQGEGTEGVPSGALLHSVRRSFWVVLICIPFLLQSNCNH